MNRCNIYINPFVPKYIFFFQLRFRVTIEITVTEKVKTIFNETDTLRNLFSKQKTPSYNYWFASWAIDYPAVSQTFTRFPLFPIDRLKAREKDFLCITAFFVCLYLGAGRLLFVPVVFVAKQRSDVPICLPLTRP